MICICKEEKGKEKKGCWKWNQREEGRIKKESRRQAGKGKKRKKEYMKHTLSETNISPEK